MRNYEKIILSLVLLISVVFIAGCNINVNVNKNTNDDNTPKLVANTKFNAIKMYIPIEYDYKPDLRGLAYTADERKLFIKGEPTDRSEAIIVDLIKQKLEGSLSDYVEKVNKNLTDVKYAKLKDEPLIYVREKYQGKSGETIIYNYTYFVSYDGYLYMITVSGPQSKEAELNTLKGNILDTLKVGEK